MRHKKRLVISKKKKIISRNPADFLPLDLYGKGSAKSFDALKKEIAEGEALITWENGKPVRNIHVLKIIVKNHNGEILAEDRQEFNDGKIRRREMKWIAEKIKPGEKDLQKACFRAIKEELDITLPDSTRFENIGEEISEGESQSYPGLNTKTTVYVFRLQLPRVFYRPGGYKEVQKEKTNYFVWEKEEGDIFAHGGNVFDRGSRPSPRESATLYPEGTVKEGQDGNMWEIGVDSRGVHRWKKSGKVEIARDEIDKIIDKLRLGKFDKITVQELSTLDDEINFTTEIGGFGGGLTKSGIARYVGDNVDEIFDRINYISPQRLTKAEQIQSDSRLSAKANKKAVEKSSRESIFKKFIAKYGEPPTRFIKVEQQPDTELWIEVYPFSETGTSHYEAFSNEDYIVEFLKRFMDGDKKKENPKSVEIAQWDNGKLVGWKKPKNYAENNSAIPEPPFFTETPILIRQKKSNWEEMTPEEYAETWKPGMKWEGDKEISKEGFSVRINSATGQSGLQKAEPSANIFALLKIVKKMPKTKTTEQYIKLLEKIANLHTQKQVA